MFDIEKRPKFLFIDIDGNPIPVYLDDLPKDVCDTAIKNENIGKPTIDPIDKYNTGIKNIKEYFNLLNISSTSSTCLVLLFILSCSLEAI